MTTGLKLVDTRRYVLREPGTRTIAGFEPVWHDVPQHRWSWVEDEALGSRERWCDVEGCWARGTEIIDLMPTIQAVQFCEDGTVRPLKTTDPEETPKANTD